MLMKDWIGKKVTLAYDIETRGGEKFAEGTLMVVAGHHRGRLNLRLPRKNEVSIRQVPRRDVNPEGWLPT